MKSPELQVAFDVLCAVTLVESGGGDDVLRVDAFVERLELSAIVSVTRRQMESHCAVFVYGDRMDLGGETTPRASQSLLWTVFFGAPAACW